MRSDSGDLDSCMTNPEVTCQHWNMSWFSVRSFYRFEASADDWRDTYEERVVIFEAEDADAAIAMAEAEAGEHVDLLGQGEVLACYQSFHLFDAPGEGAEVFSLIRASQLDTYLSRFFDTGDEFQHNAA